MLIRCLNRLASLNFLTLPTLLISTLILIIPTGCKGTEKVEAPSTGTTMEDYSRPLQPGERALELVTDRATIRRLAEAAYDSNGAAMIEALAGSKAWFEMASAKAHFPIEDITFDKAQASVTALLTLLRNHPSRSEFVAAIVNDYSLYRSVGWDRRGTVLFTGYCSLEFDASRERTSRFRYPLYTRPADLSSDPKTGKPLGRLSASGRTTPYPTRREIEESRLLAGSELVYLAHPLDAYIIHVNGSAKLKLPDGSKMYIGYAGKTDREYASLGQAMVKRGLLEPGSVSLKAIRDYYRNDISGLNDLLYENESYVFFTEYSESNWPAGSLNVRVTEKRSLATDKSIFPRGGAMIVDTRIPTYTGNLKTFTRLMVDQDTGGAIKAPGRADIFMGQGKAAELIAGRQKQEGEMYYLFLR